MIEIDIPGYKKLTLTHLVLDFNGTLACDGTLLPGVADRLNALSEKLTVVVLTADTFGKAAGELCRHHLFPHRLAPGGSGYGQTLGGGKPRKRFDRMHRKRQK